MLYIFLLLNYRKLLSNCVLSRERPENLLPFKSFLGSKFFRLPQPGVTSLDSTCSAPLLSFILRHPGKRTKEHCSKKNHFCILNLHVIFLAKQNKRCYLFTSILTTEHGCQVDVERMLSLIKNL